MKKQKDNLLTKIDQAERIDEKEIGSLSRAILKALAEHERLSTSELREITDSNQNTLKVKLSELVNSGWIRRHGKGRATEYSKLV